MFFRNWGEHFPPPPPGSAPMVVELAGYTSEKTFSCYIYSQHFAM